MLDEIAESQGEEDAEDFAGSIVYHLRGQLGWSVAYYTRAGALLSDASLRFATKTSSRASRKPSTRTSGARGATASRADDALWLREYTGDSIVDLIEWHIKESKEEIQ